MDKIEIITFNEVKDTFIGAIGSPKRERYEFELKLEILGEMIKTARKQRHLTQEELGQLIGVQKAQISRLEKKANIVTIDTVMRVFQALKAKVSFNVELLDAELTIS